MGGVIGGANQGMITTAGANTAISWTNHPSVRYVEMPSTATYTSAVKALANK